MAVPPADYVAYDGKRYVWPPPVGWYQGQDARWYPAQALPAEPPKDANPPWYRRYAVPLALAAGLLFGYGTHVAITPTREEITAQQFCALGDGDGANLFDVAGWMKSAQRTTEDWDAVLGYIDSWCPRWREQVLDRVEDLDD